MIYYFTYCLHYWKIFHHIFFVSKKSIDFIIFRQIEWQLHKRDKWSRPGGICMNLRKVVIERRRRQSSTIVPSLNFSAMGNDTWRENRDESGVYPDDSPTLQHQWSLSSYRSLTPPTFRVCAWWKVLVKCFKKIPHYKYLLTPKVLPFFVFHFMLLLLYFFP